ncbi:MAG: TetR/AcrR family transcriptional regulator [Oscillospiraceae bacterium]|nr:TetR/AcrR family transcriptional regulator [Oscillospiraceae bacterium]
MPPKARITKEMITNAAFELVRADGADKLNVRNVSKRLGCSTQPVMYHYGTVEELKAAVCQKADEYHTACLMDMRSEEPMMDIGLNFIRFAAQEKNLFALLFQSNNFSGKSIADLIDSDDVKPIIDLLSQMAEVDGVQAKAVFKTLAMFVYGYAGMLANNDMKYEEKTIAAELESVLYGAVAAAKMNNEKVINRKRR